MCKDIEKLLPVTASLKSRNIFISKPIVSFHSGTNLTGLEGKKDPVALIQTSCWLCRCSCLCLCLQANKDLLLKFDLLTSSALDLASEREPANSVLSFFLRLFLELQICEYFLLPTFSDLLSQQQQQQVEVSMSTFSIAGEATSFSCTTRLMHLWSNCDVKFPYIFSGTVGRVAPG